MSNKRLSLHVSLLICLTAATALTVACPSYGAKSDKQYRMSEAQLQSELMAYAERLTSVLFQALRDVVALPGGLELRPSVQANTVLSATSAMTIAADRNPETALLDMVAMVTMGRLIYEEHWLPRHGETVRPMVQAYANAEREAWQLSGKLLTEAQQSSLRELITQWRADHPGQTGFAYLRFGYLASEGQGSAESQKKAGGLFQSVRDATQQVEEARLLAERGLFLSTRMPLLLGSLGDLWTGQLVENQDIERLLGDIHRLSMAIDQLPKQISEERAAAISQGMQEINALSLATIDRTMKNIAVERQQALTQFFSELNKERKDTLQDLLGEEDTYSRLLAQVNTTLDGGNTLLVSATDLVKQLPIPDPNEAPDDASPAMSIDDIRAAMADLNGTIQALTALLAAVEKTTGSPGMDKINQLIVSSMDQAGKEGEALIDLSFKRGMLLTLFAVAALFFAQVLFVYFKRKLVGDAR